MDTGQYLRNTPLVRWKLEKLQRTPNTVSRDAAAKGLTLLKSEAVNLDTYELIRKGEVLRVGTLDSLDWFLQHYGF